MMRLAVLRIVMNVLTYLPTMNPYVFNSRNLIYCTCYFRADLVYPLTSLDVICHELGHAVTAWHGGNMEYFGEAGSINEAYSDMLGMCNRNTHSFS